jgi:predicted Fe-Mo cluster-binding NifX family protein
VIRPFWSGNLYGRKEDNVKIAIATDDGKTVSAHFGRATHFLVVTIEQGQVMGREMREKWHHGQNETHHHAEIPGQPHGFDPASQDRHARMGGVIEDCEAMLCRGMGTGAYSSMQSMNIRPLLIEVADVDQAISAYADGSLADHPERLH